MYVHLQVQSVKNRYLSHHVVHEVNKIYKVLEINV